MRRKQDKIKRPIEESAQIIKAREKLKKRMDAFEKKITEEALEKKIIEIQRWITKNASDRVELGAKNVSLFDGNQNTAKASQRINSLAEKLRSQLTEI